MIYIRIDSGLFELWSPSKILRYFYLQGQALNNFYEFLILISWSLLPDIKTTTVSGFSFFTDSLTSKTSTSYCAFLSIDFFILVNTQGKKQVTTQLGTIMGECYLATCLHRLLKDLKDESATINSASPFKSAVAAPILLPHRITLNP